jgi:hypothetical protein
MPALKYTVNVSIQNVFWIQNTVTSCSSKNDIHFLSEDKAIILVKHNWSSKDK